MSNKTHSKAHHLRKHKREEFSEVFQQLNAQGQSIFMVTHNPDNAALAHRIVNIRDGRMFDESNVSQSSS